MGTKDKEKEEKENMDEWRKQIQEEQQRLHPEIYETPKNNETA